MPKKRFSAEQIVTLLRQIEVSMAQGKPTPMACLDAGISQQSSVMNFSTGEIFYTLEEARVIIERWRRHYNTVRPHSSLSATGRQPQRLYNGRLRNSGQLRRPPQP